MATSLGNLILTLGVDGGGLSSGMRRARGDVTGFSESAGRGLDSAKEKVLGLTSAVGSLAGAAGGLSAAGAIGFGVKLAAEAEQTRVALAVITGSAEDARKVFDDVSDFAASTPFESDSLLSSARALLAFGSSTSEVQDELEVLGNLAAGTNTRIENLAEIFGKARAQQTIFSEDLNQLGGRGIPILDALAERMGVASSEVKQLASDGRISFNDLRDALFDLGGESGRFGGLIEAQSKTVSGAFSTLRDNVKVALRDAAQEVLDTVDAAALIENATDFVKDLSVELVDLARSAAQFVVENRQLIAGIVETAAKVAATLIVLQKLHAGYKLVAGGVQLLVGAYKLGAAAEAARAEAAKLASDKTSTAQAKTSKAYDLSAAKVAAFEKAQAAAAASSAATAGPHKAHAAVVTTVATAYAAAAAAADNYSRAALLASRVPPPASLPAPAVGRSSGRRPALPEHAAFRQVPGVLGLPGPGQSALPAIPARFDPATGRPAGGRRGPAYPESGFVEPAGVRRPVPPRPYASVPVVPPPPPAPVTSNVPRLTRFGKAADAARTSAGRLGTGLASLGATALTTGRGLTAMVGSAAAFAAVAGTVAIGARTAWKSLAEGEDVLPALKETLIEAGEFTGLAALARAAVEMGEGNADLFETAEALEAIAETRREVKDLRDGLYEIENVNDAGVANLVGGLEELRDVAAEAFAEADGYVNKKVAGRALERAEADLAQAQRLLELIGGRDDVSLVDRDAAPEAAPDVEASVPVDLEDLRRQLGGNFAEASAFAAALTDSTSALDQLVSRGEAVELGFDFDVGDAGELVGARTAELLETGQVADRADDLVNAYDVAKVELDAARNALLASPTLSEDQKRDLRADFDAAGRTLEEGSADLRAILDEATTADGQIELDSVDPTKLFDALATARETVFKFSEDVKGDLGGLSGFLSGLDLDEVEIAALADASTDAAKEVGDAQRSIEDSLAELGSDLDRLRADLDGNLDDYDQQVRIDAILEGGAAALLDDEAKAELERELGAIFGETRTIEAKLELRDDLEGVYESLRTEEEKQARRIAEQLDLLKKGFEEGLLGEAGYLESLRRIREEAEGDDDGLDDRLSGPTEFGSQAAQRVLYEFANPQDRELDRDQSEAQKQTALLERTVEAIRQLEGTLQPTTLP